MLSNQDFFPTEQSGPNSSAEALNQALGEVEHALEQILALAQLSASDLDVDRDTLQKTVEHLQRKIDHIADNI